MGIEEFDLWWDKLMDRPADMDKNLAFFCWAGGWYAKVNEWLSNASQPGVEADRKKPCHSCDMYANDYGTNFCGYCGLPLN